MIINKRKDKLIARLKDKEHRDAYVSANIDIGISFQIRALREKRGWTQKELADLLGKRQPWVNKIENNYSGFSLKTLKELSSVFNVALIVRFAPFGELVEWELALTPEKLEAVSFDEDPYFKPSIYTHVAQGGVKIGGGGIVSFYAPEAKPKAEPKTNLLDFNNARQKAAENKMATDQKELNISSYEYLARANQ